MIYNMPIGCYKIKKTKNQLKCFFINKIYATKVQTSKR